MYLHQVRQTGVLGLVGYVVFAPCYLGIMCTSFVAAYVLPAIAGTDPGYVNDVTAEATDRGTRYGDIGLLAEAIKVQGVGYLLGGLLFGIALYRARVLAPLGRSAPRRRRRRLRRARRDAGRLLPLPGLPERHRHDRPGLLAVDGRPRRRRNRVGRRRAPGAQHGRRRVNHLVGPDDAGSQPGTGAAPVPGRARRAGWWVPPALLALAVIPVAGGTGRLIEVLGGPEVLPTDARFAASPVPLVVHIVAAVVYAVLGAFQFSARLRRRHPGWHRRAGRLLVGARPRGRVLRAVDDAGLPPKEGTGDILWVTRLLVSSGMGASLILGVVAIRNRNIARHRAWMTRAYALALGAGTQAFTVGFGEAVFGAGVVRTDLMMAAAWAINLAVAEWIIRRPAATTGQACPHRPGRCVMTPRPPDAATSYELRVGGHLDQHWSTWFDGFTLTHEDDGTTTLRGAVTRPVRAARPARQGPRPRHDPHLGHASSRPPPPIPRSRTKPMRQPHLDTTDGGCGRD